MLISDTMGAHDKEIAMVLIVLDRWTDQPVIVSVPVRPAVRRDEPAIVIRPRQFAGRSLS
ncbi:hypothetical protein [Microvirga sesbaniae]|uniref:hypothetical protein n=1 Tax=Microvirga sesbaniae TaxID=681392 RepID=UPI0021C65001|nr:hypothetical protein [Microvirga sp. HBU67692]